MIVEQEHSHGSANGSFPFLVHAFIVPGHFAVGQQGRSERSRPGSVPRRAATGWLSPAAGRDPAAALGAHNQQPGTHGSLEQVVDWPVLATTRRISTPGYLSCQPVNRSVSNCCCSAATVAQSRDSQNVPSCSGIRISLQVCNTTSGVAHRTACSTANSTAASLPGELSTPTTTGARGSPPGELRTTTTGQWACWATRDAVEPTRSATGLSKPRAASTTSQACRDSSIRAARSEEHTSE